MSETDEYAEGGSEVETAGSDAYAYEEEMLSCHKEHSSENPEEESESETEVHESRDDKTVSSDTSTQTPKRVIKKTKYVAPQWSDFPIPIVTKCKQNKILAEIKDKYSVSKMIASFKQDS